MVVLAGGGSCSLVLTLRVWGSGWDKDSRPQTPNNQNKMAVLNFCSVHQPAGPTTMGSKDDTKQWCFQLKMPTGL